MTQITRRSVVKGAAWSAPAVAVASQAPTLAASTTCELTDEQLNAGDCSQTAASWFVTDNHTYSTTGGGSITRVNQANNIGLRSDCNYTGSVTFKIHNNSGEAYIPAPTAQLADGREFTGAATLGNVLTGIAQVGWDSSFNIRWEDSAGTNVTPDPWEGALITVPMELSYTAPDGSVHTCMVALQYTLTEGLTSGAIRQMTGAQFISY
ncbi:hypothetical protein CYJ76_03370 [Kytococcus schroeteri]|uniref:Tat pathway signal sequence domain protein n=1 Tax=Kytococcus schroeteri TaxID=138300 RepID=A0A2I1PCI5_9MICO|nr:hypothetical protein [Kytococcus schroeteri]PKZ42343.1 hypothetical protein CYJ76_03370 [Kytococcus schroeteri]